VAFCGKFCLFSFTFKTFHFFAKKTLLGIYQRVAFCGKYEFQPIFLRLGDFVLLQHPQIHFFRKLLIFSIFLLFAY